MTDTAHGLTPRPLPMAGRTHGNRSPLTCHLRCGNACSFEAPNTTDTTYFRDVAAGALSRRAVLGAGVAATALGTLATTATPAAAGPRGNQDGERGGYGLPFTAIAPVAVTVDDVTVPRGYSWEPIIRWGDPILKGAPAFDAANQSPEAQVRQFGYNNDYLDIIETNRQRHARPAGLQPRVHQREHHVPARHRPRARDPHGLGRARPVRRRARAPGTAATRGATSRAPASTDGSPSTPCSASTALRPAPTCSRPRRTRPVAGSGAP